MTREEINELLQRRNWKKERLAVEVQCSVASIHAWIRDGAAPDGATSILMRLWLREARGEIKIVELRQAVAV